MLLRKYTRLESEILSEIKLVISQDIDVRKIPVRDVVHASYKVDTHVHVFFLLCANFIYRSV